MDLTLTVPEEVACALPLPAEERQQRLQTEMACMLYAKGWLSYGQATRVAGLDSYQFGLELGERQIPRHYDDEEAAHDLEYASRQQYVADL